MTEVITYKDASAVALAKALGELTFENNRLREQITELQRDSNEKLQAIRELRAGRLSSQVAEFRRMAGFGRAQDVPHVPTKEVLIQHLLPVVEEFFELICAVCPDMDHGGNNDLQAQLVSQIIALIDDDRVDMPELADAMADLDYTVEGLRQSCGIDGTPIAKAVHQANLLKRGGRVDGNGKLQKPEGFAPPDIAGELRKQGWRG